MVLVRLVVRVAHAALRKHQPVVNDLRSVRLALVSVLALGVLALAFVLTEKPRTVLESNSSATTGGLVTLNRGTAHVCQDGESLPARTRAIRLSVGDFTGPSIAVTATAGQRVLASGTQASGWTGTTVTVPVHGPPTARAPVEICATSGAIVVPLILEGVHAPPAARARLSGSGRLVGKLKIEFLGTGQASWLTLAGSVAEHMSRGRAWNGEWVAFVVAILMLAIVFLLCGLALGRVRVPQRLARLLPPACWACMVVAALSAVSWSLITPAFQVTDEQDHYAYVQLFAETGDTPGSDLENFSGEELLALEALGWSHIRLAPSHRAIYTSAQQAALTRRLASFNANGEERNTAAGVAASQPPLYYALEAIPYKLGSNLLARLQLMRLLSAIFAVFTTLFVYLFLREALPRARWAWMVGALGVALCPLLGFMSGAVNPDSMLFAVSAALFWCIARAFRRGLSERLAILTGIVMAIGLVTKLNFVGLLPGALLALILLAASGRRHTTPRAFRTASIAAGIGLLPAIAYVIAQLASGGPTFGIVTNTLRASSGSLFQEADFIWQFYLPRLPGTHAYFPGLSMARQTWFNGFIGRFGWLDTMFPSWVYVLALAAAVVLTILALRAMAAARGALGQRLPELAVYFALAAGLLVTIGASGYREVQNAPTSYGEARYLLPLLALYGALLALAVRGVGRRLGPAAGVVLIALLLAHDVFSQLQTIARFYG